MAAQQEVGEPPGCSNGSSEPASHITEHITERRRRRRRLDRAVPVIDRTVTDDDDAGSVGRLVTSRAVVCQRSPVAVDDGSVDTPVESGGDAAQGVIDECVVVRRPGLTHRVVDLPMATVGVAIGERSIEGARPEVGDGPGRNNGHGGRDGIGPAGRQHVGHEGAEAVADDNDLPHVECVEDSSEVGRMLVDPADRREVRRRSPTPKIGSHPHPSGREPFQQPPTDPPVGDEIVDDENGGAAVADTGVGHEDGQVAIVDGNVAEAGSRHPPDASEPSIERGAREERRRM